MKTRSLLHRVRQVKTCTRASMIEVPPKQAMIVPGHARLKLPLDVRAKIREGTSEKLPRRLRLFGHTNQHLPNALPKRLQKPTLFLGLPPAHPPARCIHFWIFLFCSGCPRPSRSIIPFPPSLEDNPLSRRLGFPPSAHIRLVTLHPLPHHPTGDHSIIPTPPPVNTSLPVPIMRRPPSRPCTVCTSLPFQQQQPPVHKSQRHVSYLTKPGILATTRFFFHPLVKVHLPVKVPRCQKSQFSVEPSSECKPSCTPKAFSEHRGWGPGRQGGKALSLPRKAQRCPGCAPQRASQPRRARARAAVRARSTPHASRARFSLRLVGYWTDIQY